MPLITPPYLQKGDTIGIVCTARKISKADIAKGIDIINSWGFKVIVGNSVGAADNQYGGSDVVRRADLQRMLDNPDIKAIISARGGYGTVRIVDGLDWTKFKQHPKWILGYSDITVLHSHIYRNLGIETLHASMPISFPKNTPEALASLYKALTGQAIEYTWPSQPLDRKGTATAELVGGNLSLLFALSGSASDIDTTGKILFIEDIGEYRYHFDRMMMQIKRSGKLDNLAGLIVGGLTDITDNKDHDTPFGKTAEQIVHEHVRGFSYPVAFGFPAGHIPDNRALIIGREAEMSVSGKGNRLVFEN